MINRLLDTIAHICLRHTRQIFLIFAVLAALAIAGASLLSFDPDILSLVPQQNREVNEFRKVLDDMGTIDYHIVAIELPEGHDVGEYEGLIRGIAERYEESPLIEDVAWRIPNPIELIEEILPKALLFLTPEELERVAYKLRDEEIRASVARNRALLQTPQAFALEEVIRYDPFNLLPIYLGKLGTAGTGFRIDVASGYYLSEDHSLLIILTKPQRPAQDTPFAQRLLEEAGRIEREAMQEFREENPQVPAPVIGYTGGYAVALGDANLIRNDAITNILFSFFGVLLLFLYAFRRVASIAYAGIPMALGLGMTFGIAGVTYGVLSPAAAGFSALLAGLGIDFITVLYGRYIDERNRGTSLEESIRLLLHRTFPGVFVAAITTSATFFAFLATDFRGMRQLGFLTGIGILFFLLSVTFLLPALLVFTERRQKDTKAPKLFLHSFGSHHLIHWSIHHRRLTIALWTVFILIAGALGTQVRFSDNIQDLRAKGNPGVIWQERLTKTFGQSFNPMMYVIEGETLEDVLARTEQAQAKLQPLVEDDVIASYQSIASWVPPLEQQREIIRLLEEGRGDRFSPLRISETFRRALVESGFRPGSYDEYMELFTQALTPEKPATVEDIENEMLERLTSRFVRRTAGGWMSVIYLYPEGGVWGRSVPPRLLALNDEPDSILTGINLVSETLRGIVRADAVRATVIGFVAVFILMLLSFRSLRIAAMTFVPFIAGASGMFGLMAMLDLEFNFMNIFVGLMIIGVATDYAIYMIERFLESPANFRHSAEETGKAVVMAAITSIVGYGSFALSHYPGLRSIGYASTFGIGLSGLAAITLVPALFMTRIFRKKHKREHHGSEMS